MCIFFYSDFNLLSLLCFGSSLSPELFHDLSQLQETWLAEGELCKKKKQRVADMVEYDRAVEDE